MLKKKKIVYNPKLIAKMKKVYKTLAVTAALLVGSTFAFAQTTTSVAIDEDQSGIIITTVGSTIVAEGVDAIEVFSINGSKVDAEGELIPGIYIVKATAGQTVKVEKVIVK